MTSSTDNAPAVPKRDEDKIVIFDTTLRDGEQCPGATMTFEEKLQVAELLDDMGVDVIEAGFPIASEGDFEAVTEIAKLAKALGHLRSGSRQLRRHRSGGRSHQARQARPYPYLHRHVAAASPASAATRPGPGPRARDRFGNSGARLHRRRRVERDGRDTHRA